MIVLVLGLILARAGFEFVLGTEIAVFVRPAFAAAAAKLLFVLLRLHIGHHPEVMIGKLQVIFGQHPVIVERGIMRQLAVLFQHLRRVAACARIDPVALNRAAAATAAAAAIVVVATPATAIVVVAVIVAAAAAITIVVQRFRFLAQSAWLVSARRSLVTAASAAARIPDTCVPSRCFAPMPFQNCLGQCRSLDPFAHTRCSDGPNSG